MSGATNPIGLGLNFPGDQGFSTPATPAPTAASMSTTLAAAGQYPARIATRLITNAEVLAMLAGDTDFQMVAAVANTIVWPWACAYVSNSLAGGWTGGGSITWNPRYFGQAGGVTSQFSFNLVSSLNGAGISQERMALNLQSENNQAVNSYVGKAFGIRGTLTAPVAGGGNILNGIRFVLWYNTLNVVTGAIG